MEVKALMFPFSYNSSMNSTQKNVLIGLGVFAVVFLGLSIVMAAVILKGAVPSSPPIAAPISNDYEKKMQNEINRYASTFKTCPHTMNDWGYEEEGLLDNLDNSAQRLSELPTPPAELAAKNAMIQKLIAETYEYTSDYRLSFQDDADVRQWLLHEQNIKNYLASIQ